MFQSTPPARGATLRRQRDHRPGLVSIHAPRTGGDGQHRTRYLLIARFQSTPPARGATLTLLLTRAYPKSFNPRPPHGGRLHGYFHGISFNFVSIHAPRTGGDRRRQTGRALDRCFNPRPPHGGRRRLDAQVKRLDRFNPRPPHGGRPRAPIMSGIQVAFQSTPPARGATPGVVTRKISIDRFNPRPPHGGRPCNLAPCSSRWTFQSTPPARGATPGYVSQQNVILQFQSTPPARGATKLGNRILFSRDVSIHAPRTGGRPE